MSRSRKPAETPPALLMTQAISALVRSDEVIAEEEVRRTGFGLRREPRGHGNTGYMDLAFPSAELTVARSACTMGEASEDIATADRDYVRIRLGLAGDLQMRWSREALAVKSPVCVLGLQPRGTEFRYTTEALRPYRQVNIMLARGTLTEAWGFDLATLPEPLRGFEAGQLRDLLITTLPMSPGLVSIATDILECGFVGALLDQYLETKVRETFCLMMAALQGAAALDIASAPPEEPLRLTQRDRQQLAEVRRIMDDSFAAPPRLATLARRVGLNRTKLCAGFQAEFGLSIHEYARELRLQRALQLLREDRISVTEIALEVGYEHSSSLATAVKKRFGVSPRLLRQHRKP